MKKSKSSRQWLDRHFRDEYVKRAQVDGYRSRAAYKLLEIQGQDKLFRPGQVVVDLGAAPGGWSQVAKRLVGASGRVVALDLLSMEPLDGVIFLQGDVVDLVLSDMAPNVSGVSAVDQPKSIYLCEIALDFAKEVLRPGGSMLIKVFQGEGFDHFVRELRNHFTRVQTRKPSASRPKSREVYLVAGNFNL